MTIIKNYSNVIYIFIFFLVFMCNQMAYSQVNTDQSKVIATIKKAENYIKKNGIEKAIVKFKSDSRDIVVGDYKGIFYVSPLHPDQIGKNLYNYRDSSGVLVVQEEIEKAKSGGGWLKGRWRENPQTGKYQCRKIYIHPISGNYFIGSWYHYSPKKPGVCNE